MTDTVPQERRRVAGAADSDEAPPERSPDNVAPMVAYLASEASDWSSGRTYRCSGYAVGLYNNPEVISEVTSEGAWTLADLTSKVESTFKPIASGLPPR
jgi:hypothetical protein